MTAEERQKKREEFIARGVNLRDFCKEKNIDYQAARELMCGKSKGRRGKAHKAAVVLGLKADPETMKLAA